MALGFAAAVAWAAVCTLDGGMAMGNNPGTPGTLGAAAGLTAFAVLAAWGLWRCRGRVDRWGGAALAAAAAWAAWNAASVAWAVEPSLAWLAANRAVMLAAAIAVGVSLAAV
ncbi:MAG: hypothetical protein KDC33_12580, partial [Thermoleophilia bacterium]|nr:hypothetical protein [Thermoleophilia bacterium]